MVRPSSAPPYFRVVESSACENRRKPSPACRPGCRCPRQETTNGQDHFVIRRGFDLHLEDDFPLLRSLYGVADKVDDHLVEADWGRRAESLKLRISWQSGLPRKTKKARLLGLDQIEW